MILGILFLLYVYFDIFFRDNGITHTDKSYNKTIIGDKLSVFVILKLIDVIHVVKTPATLVNLEEHMIVEKIHWILYEHFTKICRCI